MATFDPFLGRAAGSLDEIRHRARGRVLVVGLGASGRGALELLARRGADVRGYDRTPPADLGIPVFGGETPPPEALERVDLVVLSPGVPPERVVPAMSFHAPNARATGEFALGLAHLFEVRPDVEAFLVTGTNGKSTTTHVLAHLLEASGRDVFAGGNLGPSLAAHLASDPPRHTYVLEASSFQLETYPGAPARAAVVTNVTPDHLDRYPDLAAYAATKARVFAGMAAGRLAVVGPGLPSPAAPPDDLRRVEIDPNAVDGPSMRIGTGTTVEVAALRLVGHHNRMNVACALAVAVDIGVSPETCAEALARVEPLPHRCAFVARIDGVDFYDDSKATNVASAVATLRGLDRTFVLIAGGRAKPGDDPTPLVDAVAEKGRAAVLVGESAEVLARHLGRIVPVDVVPDMDAAVAAARAMAQPGDAVVLAPAAASYDRYRNFEERGRDFARAVHAAASHADTPPHP
ncbi:MAG: UDP-N-acetylmuramoyl-L-alanine--D-glutamate ligase [Deltaproteobacteria bacterium]|nr:MAG: UDP-N-acetylmuramoyl-L-alanine--D-glutamate ligase [Deltaproteobacteria bacterium]